jgi:AraC-type transcriptional regulator
MQSIRQAEHRDLERARAGRDELAERSARHLSGDGSREAAPGLFRYRSSVPTGPRYGVNEPSFCVIAQGAKEVLLGDERYRYSHIIEASRERPYLAVRLVLDPRSRAPTDAHHRLSTRRKNSRTSFTFASRASHEVTWAASL